MRNMTLILVGVIVVGMLAGQAAATDFPVSGGGYLANVAAQVDTAGNWATVVGASFTESAASASDPLSVIDGRTGTRLVVTGMGGAGDSARAVVDMGQVWSINQIHTEYGYWNPLPATYKLSVFTNGSTWTDVVPATAVGGEQQNNTFAATDARYIAWEVSGPGGAT